MIIYLELLRTRERTGIRLVPFPMDYSTVIEHAYSSSVTATTNFTLEVPTLREPEYEPDTDKYPVFSTHLIALSGKIKMIWSRWHGRYLHWAPIALECPKDKPVLDRMRHFSGFVCHNRGRHWDRKRRI